MVKKKCAWVTVMDGQKVYFLTKNKVGHLIDLAIEIPSEPFNSDRGGGEI